MRILILHHHRFSALRYDQAIDHHAHDVTYAGTANFLRNIPGDVRCGRFEIRSMDTVFEETSAWAASQPAFDLILTRHESMILPAARLRDALGVRGMTATQALRFRDKIVMKRAIADAGLRVPMCAPADALPAVLPWSGKTVLKPRGGSASEGVKVFDTAAEAAAAVAERAQEDAGFAREHEIEEYVDGEIWHVDGYLYAGQPVVVQTSRYVNTPLDFEHGKPLGSVQIANDALARWALRCVGALGVDTLSFHLEAILSTEGPVFMEIAARCGGGYIVDLMELRHGTFLHALDMASAVDGQVSTRFAPKPADARSFAGFFFPAHVHGGRPCRVKIDRERLAAPPMLSYSMLSEETETVREATYRMDLAPLSGVAADPDPAMLERWMRALFDDVKVLA